jgi:putative ABC transport system permease protein
MITPDFFHTLRIPLRSGRAFTDRDRAGAPPVAIISRAFERKYLHGENPLGKRLDTAGLSCEIVGVAGDVRYGKVREEEAEPAIYVPFAQKPTNRIWLLLQTSSPAMGSFESVRHILKDLDPELPVEVVTTTESTVSVATSDTRFHALALGLLAAVALLLAAVGVYGVIAFTVRQRVREFGIRLALGAGAGKILRMVLGQVVALLAAAVLIGLASAFVLSRWLTEFLFGVTPADPVTFGAVTALLCAIALCAGYLPARRATRIDPMDALRSE